MHYEWKLKLRSHNTSYIGNYGTIDAHNTPPISVLTVFRDSNVSIHKT